MERNASSSHAPGPVWSQGLQDSLEGQPGLFMEDRGKELGNSSADRAGHASLSLRLHISKKGLLIPAPQPLGASVRICRHSGSACSRREVSPSPPSVTNRTCGPNNPWSPTARLPQRPWEAASTRAIAETGLILKYAEEAERQATSAFRSHTEVPAQRAHLNSQASATGSLQVLREHWQAVSLQLIMAGSSAEAPLCASREPWNVGMIAPNMGGCDCDLQRLPFPSRHSFQETPNLKYFIYPSVNLS